jgi:hypothetical protein
MIKGVCVIFLFSFSTLEPTSGKNNVAPVPVPPPGSPVNVTAPIYGSSIVKFDDPFQSLLLREADEGIVAILVNFFFYLFIYFFALASIK